MCQSDCRRGGTGDDRSSREEGEAQEKSSIATFPTVFALDQAFKPLRQETQGTVCNCVILFTDLFTAIGGGRC